MPADLLAVRKALGKVVEEAYGVDFGSSQEKTLPISLSSLLKWLEESGGLVRDSGSLSVGLSDLRWFGLHVLRKAHSLV